MLLVLTSSVAIVSRTTLALLPSSVSSTNHHRRSVFALSLSGLFGEQSIVDRGNITNRPTVVRRKIRYVRRVHLLSIFLNFSFMMMISFVLTMIPGMADICRSIQGVSRSRRHHNSRRILRSLSTIKGSSDTCDSTKV